VQYSNTFGYGCELQCHTILGATVTRLLQALGRDSVLNVLIVVKGQDKKYQVTINLHAKSFLVGQVLHYVISMED